MNFIQCNPPVPVETIHGPGMALFLIDYGHHWNTVWIVALKETREIKHYDSNDVRLSVNYTFNYL